MQAARVHSSEEDRMKLSARQIRAWHRFRLVLATFALAAITVVVAPSTAGAATAVTHWSQVAEQTIPVGRGPASSQQISGVVHAAIYDTVAATEGGLVPFASFPTVAAGASTDAAVATAARDVLIARVPLQAVNIRAAYDLFIASIPDGDAKTAGIAVGAEVAADHLAARAGDGFGVAVPFVQATPGPGVFEPVLPTPPVETSLSQMQTFTFASADFRPNGPSRLDSDVYTRDFAEVKAYGRSDSSVRTDAQTQTARFWTDQTYVQWSRTVRQLAEDRLLNVRETARLLGLVHVTAGETVIACYEAKYHFNFWRPIDAIRRADTDGNPATTPDRTWTHLVAANHPEYPSGHSCFTGSVTEALAIYFKTDRLPLTVSSNAANAGPPRSYERLSAVRADVDNARVWSGLHFRNSMVEGSKVGRKVAHAVAPHFFRQPYDGS